VTAPQINQALLQYTDDLGGGRAKVGQRELTVRVLGSARTVDSLRALQIPLPGGRYVRLDEIATIGDGAGEKRGFAMLDGHPVASFQVSKTKGASDVAVEKEVLKAIAQLKKQHPEVVFTQILSTVQNTRESYTSTVHVLIEGMVLAVVVVFLFLKEWRATGISALAMPASLIPTFGAMAVFGFSINIVTLLALNLVIGMLVDDAIVEIENIQKRIERGQRPYQAALEGADAIGLAVIATTFTIVAVFVPVSMMNSSVGQFFREFGVTVAMSVLFSLLVARLMTPLMAAYFLKPHPHPRPARPMPERYKRTIPTGFQPSGDPGYIYMDVQGPPGATRQDMERAVLATTRLFNEQPDVDTVFAQIGSAGANGDITSGRILAKLKDHRSHTTDQMKQLMRDKLPLIADARVTYQSGNGGGADLTVILASQNGPALAKAQEQLVRQMRGLTDLIGDPRLARSPASPPSATSTPTSPSSPTASGASRSACACPNSRSATSASSAGCRCPPCRARPPTWPPWPTSTSRPVPPASCATTASARPRSWPTSSPA